MISMMMVGVQRMIHELPPTLLLVFLLAGSFVSFSLFYHLIRVSLLSYGYILRLSNSARRRKALASLGVIESPTQPKKIVGFFHPYCNAGGGGERVLWTAIAFMQRTQDDLISVVYTGDMTTTTKEAMIDKVKARFGIELDPRTLLFVSLRSRNLVEDKTWSRFTLLGQSLGSMWLALEGLRNGLIPDVWIDTMGYAFAYPVVRGLCQIPVGSYTHYPTISQDMIDRVSSRRAGHTNTGLIASSAILTQFKLTYYRLFAYAYSHCLRQADVLMVNSTWTKRHVDRMLRPFHWHDDEDDIDHQTLSPISLTTPASDHSDGLRSRAPVKLTSSAITTTTTVGRKYATIVYPPCDTLAFSSLPLERSGNIILSVAQFRPEKEHATQLHALRLFFDQNPTFETGPRAIKLIMAGSVRGVEDEARVEKLRELAETLKLSKSVEFKINVPYPELISLFGQASIGLHTMIDEHFGITVVEIMAAGLIPLVHASAGPYLDIVVPFESNPTGFHATTAETFAQHLQTICEMSELEVRQMRERARRNAVERFSTEEFERGWDVGWQQLIH